MAAAAYFDQIQKIYIAFYQRPADPAGLRYWAGKVNDAEGDLSQIINAFAASTEANTLYGAIDASTIGGVIDSLYLALFDRPPEAAGRQFYIDSMAAGTFTPASIALAVLCRRSWKCRCGRLHASLALRKLNWIVIFGQAVKCLAHTATFG